MFRQHLVAFGAISLLVATTGAFATPKQDCATAVSALGHALTNYTFEEGGIFSMEKHRFGDVTCYVNALDEIDSIYFQDELIAEDGYFGRTTLNEKKQLEQQALNEMAEARARRDEKINDAREQFLTARSEINERLDAALAALRASSDPFDLKDSASIPIDTDSYVESIMAAILEGEFLSALRTWENQSLSDKLAIEDVESLENAALSQVRPIPAENYVANRDGYRLLTEINGSSKIYMEKLQHYSHQVRGGVCKAIVAFNFPDVDPSQMDVSDASRFPNPRALPSPLLIEYTRTSDGTQWRYLCSLQDPEITFSVLSGDGQPGRMWVQPTPEHRKYTYELDGMMIEITEIWPDSSRIVKTLDLK